MATWADAQQLGDYLASYVTISLDGVAKKIDRNPATTTQGAITNPEGRLAPTELAPWKDAQHILDEIFHYLYNLDSTTATFPSRLHVNKTVHELSIINSEAAVHLFDVDTVYKPAKRVIDFALRQPSVRDAISARLRSLSYSGPDIISSHEGLKGEVVFSPHYRTITVPTYASRGQKRKRSTSLSSGSEEAPSTISEGPGRSTVPLEDRMEDSIQVADEIQVESTPTPDPSPGSVREVTAAPPQAKISIKSGPGDYYCSLVNHAPSLTPESPSSRLLLIGEAKAPHKLTRDLIASALGTNSYTIDTRQFIQRPEQDPGSSPPEDVFTRPNASDGYTYHNQRWLSAVATQIYSTLVQKELRYGYITTGESYILVRIRPGEPTAMDYFLLPPISASPLHDTQAGGEDARVKWLAGTPLARLSCLALMSIFAGGNLTEAEVEQANASRASMIWQTPRHRERSLETRSFVSSVATRDSDPDWIEPQAGAERHIRQRSLKRPRDRQDASSATADSGHWVGTAKRQRLTTPPSNIESARPPTMLEMPREETRLPRRLTPPPETYQQIKELLFCTTSCVSSLINHAAPDSSCPNWSMHQQCQRRPTSRSELLALARSSITLPLYSRAFEQCDTEEEPPISRIPTENAIYTGQFGAVAAIFKVRIQPGGYVLLAKAARHYEPFMKMDTVYRLQREEMVYKRLRALQGKTIPLCIGLVNHSDNLQDHVDHLHGQLPAFLLFSWAGSSLLSRVGLFNTPYDAQHAEARLAQIRLHIEAHLDQVHSKGILHGDAELRNIVVSGTDISFVDFERASSKGQIQRRAAGGAKLTMTADWDAVFQSRSEREKVHCLDQFDKWAERLLRL